MTGNNGSERDKWAAWVLDRSHGGDAIQKERSLEYLRPIRDRVLANASNGPGITVFTRTFGLYAPAKPRTRPATSNAPPSLRIIR